jgi:hypothetical protein
LGRPPDLQAFLSPVLQARLNYRRYFRPPDLQAISSPELQAFFRLIYRRFLSPVQQAINSDTILSRLSK